MRSATSSEIAAPTTTRRWSSSQPSDAKAAERQTSCGELLSGEAMIECPSLLLYRRRHFPAKDLRFQPVVQVKRRRFRIRWKPGAHLLQPRVRLFKPSLCLVAAT